MGKICKILTGVMMMLIVMVSIGANIPVKTASAGYSGFIVPLFSGYVEDASKASIISQSTVIDMSKYNGVGGIGFETGKITATNSYTISNTQAESKFCIYVW